MKHLLLPLVLLAGIFIPTANATHDPNDFFVQEANFPAVAWADIHATATTDVWAVGNTAGVGTVGHRTGGIWTIEVVTGAPAFTKVWAESSTIVYAAASNGRAWRLSGGTWTDIGTLTSPNGAGFIGDVYGVLPTVLGVGSSNFNLPSGNTPRADAGAYTGTWGGNACNPLSNQEAIQQRFRTVYGISAANFQAFTQPITGSGPSFRALVSGSACVFSQQSFPPINDVWAPGAAPWTAIGTAGRIFSGDSSSTAVWAPVISPTANDLNAIHGVSATDAWAVGDAGTIIHLSGTTWTAEPTTTAANLMGVHCTTETECWAVADNGQILKLQVNPSIAAPTLGVATVHNDLFKLDATDTACIGDPSSFAMDIDIPSALVTLSDGDIYIYSYQTDSWFIDLDDSTWSPVIPGLPVSQFAADEITLPPGSYVALAIVDLTGVGIADHFDSEAFTVSKDPCIFTEADLTEIITTVINQGNQTRNVINVTETEIAGSMDLLLWLGMMIFAYWLATECLPQRKPAFKWLSVVMFIFAALWGLFRFPESFFQGFAFVAGIAGFLWAATKEETETQQ